jgi:hypothetical protein
MGVVGAGKLRINAAYRTLKDNLSTESTAVN